MAATPAPSILPSSSTDRLSTSLPRVCIVSYVISNDPDYSYDIYIVDLNSDASDGSELTPTFRVFGEFFNSSVAFFVLERTLYVVEGCDGCLDICTHNKTIFKCNLPSGSESGVKLERSMLTKAAYMCYVKKLPCAIPTPDGKRAVIYSRSVSNYPGDPLHKCDFELFDPSGGRKNRHKCRKLPQLHLFRRASCFWIEYASFIGNSVFLVHCRGRGPYAIDLELPAEERRWELLKFPQFYPYQLIGDNMCLTPYCVLDFSVDDVWRYSYPDWRSLSDSVRIVDNITPLDVVNNPRDCRFCIFRAWTEEYRDMEGEGEDNTIYVCHVMLDVYSCDVVGCRTELSREVREKGQTYEVPCTKRIKSIKFCLRPVQSPYHYLPYFSSVRWTD